MNPDFVGNGFNFTHISSRIAAKVRLGQYNYRGAATLKGYTSIPGYAVVV